MATEFRPAALPVPLGAGTDEVPVGEPVVTVELIVVAAPVVAVEFEETYTEETAVVRVEAASVVVETYAAEVAEVAGAEVTAADEAVVAAAVEAVAAGMLRETPAEAQRTVAA